MGQPYLISQTDTIVTVASWEDRFKLGLERMRGKLKPKLVIMFYYHEYEERSKNNRETTSKAFSSHDCVIIEQELHFKNPMETWKTISNSINRDIADGALVTLDISTMPREAIWIVCDCLHRKSCGIQYVYNRPEAYTEEWLSRDPGRPRFVYRLSGISRLEAPTTLLIVSGYDSERTKQLVRFYEPRNLVIGLQSGEQYENTKKNREENKKAFHRNKEIRWFDVDGYDMQATLEAIEAKLEEFDKTSNIILSSLGPKISALALYKYHLIHMNSALTYAPSNEFNKDYSKGLGEPVWGRLDGR